MEKFVYQIGVDLVGQPLYVVHFVPKEEKPKAQK